MSVLAERASSPSPSRRISIGSKISAFGAKLNRTLSGQTYTGDEAVSPIIPTSDKDRSASRGREAFTSTGRGGIGNIRQASQSRDARPDSGPDDFSVTRGREALSKPQNLYSTGRGGAGNIRSPSRDVGTSPKIDEEERKVIDEYVANQGSAPVSTGRGGLGNINRSRSRDPSVTRNVFSTGRGGAGNIHPGDGAIAESVDEQERRKYSTTNDGYHSTGRGGLANITDVPKPPVEVVHPTNTHISSTGRGGAGNIYTK